MSENILKNEKNRFNNFLSIMIRRYLIFIIFIAMVVVFSVINPIFLSPRNFKMILTQASFLGIVSFGMTIVMITGGVDLSVGAVAGLATIFGVDLMLYSGFSGLEGILFGIFCGAFIGAISGLFVGRLGVAPFVATLSTMFIAQGLQYAVNGGESMGYGFPSSYLFIGSGELLNIPFPIIIFVVIFLVFLVLTEFTKWGRYIRAVGLNQFTSKLSGLRIRALTFSTYVIAGGLAAVSGLMLGASQSYIQPNLGDSFLLDALVVTLLGKATFGGKPSILGTAFGVIFIKTFETGMSMLGTPIMMMNILKGFLLLGVLLLGSFQRKMD